MSRSAGEDGADGPRDLPARNDRAEEIFFEALERERSERPELVTARCGGDRALEREVLSLLSAHEQTGPLDRLQGDLARWGESLIREDAKPAFEAEPPLRARRPPGPLRDPRAARRRRHGGGLAGARSPPRADRGDQDDRPSISAPGSPDRLVSLMGAGICSRASSRRRGRPRR